VILKIAFLVFALALGAAAIKWFSRRKRARRPDNGGE
jgi:hypothetical protein